MPIQCGFCIYWWQPDGKPLPPPQSMQTSAHTNPLWHVPEDRGPDWWTHSGLCVHHTASPAGETQMYHPRVTHATLDGCGDGKMPEED